MNTLNRAQDFDLRTATAPGLQLVDGRMLWERRTRLDQRRTDLEARRTDVETPRLAVLERKKRISPMERLFWFAVLWGGGVATVAVVAYGIRAIVVP